MTTLLAGCTRVVDDASPRAQPPPAPIAAGQVGDLLSGKTAPQYEPNLFTTVDPDRCAGLTREVDPPFLFGNDVPVAHDAGQYFTDADEPSVSVVEMVAVYPSNFAPADAVDHVKRTIEACRDDVMATTAMEGETVYFRLESQPDSESSDIALWTVTSRSGWTCDNAFIAAHNAAVELTACGDVGGYDARPLADAALKRIHALANTTA